MSSLSHSYIVNLYVKFKKIESAQVYLEKAILFNKKNNTTSKKTFDNYNRLNQGNIFFLKQKYSEAKTIFNEILLKAKKNKSSYLLMKVNFNLAELSEAQMDYKKTLDYYKSSLKFSKKLKNKIMVVKNIKAIIKTLKILMDKKSLKYYTKILKELRVNSNER